MLFTLAMSCPVCFGANDSPMAQATNTGIIFMLVVVGVVLVGFASFFITLIRRANAAARSSAASADVSSGSRYTPREGTA